MVFHIYVVNIVFNKGVYTVISTAQQRVNDSIIVAHAANQNKTEEMHTGHGIVIQRWSGTHKIRVCNTCQCTVAPLIESKAKPNNNNFDMFSRKQYEQSFKVLR